MKQELQWIATTDGRKASLFTCRTNPGGGLHIDLVRSLSNPHEHEHEHHRPSSLGGAERRGTLGGSSAHASPHSASFGHEEQEEHTRFAREVRSWIDRTATELHIQNLNIFAPPRSLGLLREEFKNGQHGRISLFEGELTHLRPNELAEHAAIRDAVTRPSIPKK